MNLLIITGTGLPTGYYIFMGIIILFGVVGLFKVFINFSDTGKKSLLDEMFENDDITSDVYKKYNKKI